MNINYNAPFTPKEITTKNKVLNIPVYQRLFVWGEEQIKLLLQDLWKAAEHPQDPYYVGIITVVENKNGWDVVDGQQRLTFLSLFGAYVVCKKKNNSSNPFYEQWKRFLYSTNEKGQKDLRINYAGRPDDKAYLQAIIDGKIDQIENQNFKVFLECIKKNSNEKDFDQFVSYVYENTSFLISELPNNYLPQDLNSFFEKMNSTGRQLTPVEQIKGKYFPAHAAEFDACMNFEVKYAKSKPDELKQANSISNETIISILGSTISIIDEKNDDHPTEEKRRSILPPEIFLLHSLTIELAQNRKDNDLSSEKRSILKTFSSKIGTGNEIASDNLLFRMQQYREWIDDNIIYLELLNGAYEYRFRKEDEQDYDDSKLDLEPMRQFQSMLYVSSDEWQGWVLDAYRKCQGRPLTLESLKSLDKRLHQLPEISNLSYYSVNRYWFWKLDFILWEKTKEQIRKHQTNQKDETLFVEIALNNDVIKIYLNTDNKDAIINYKFRRNRSIEHLHPQADENKWTEEEKHHFGNLALISSGSNSAQGNDSIGVKFARVKDTQIPQKNLESIKMLLMFLIAGGNESGWNPDVSVKHGEQMYKLLKEYYESIPDTKE